MPRSQQSVLEERLRRILLEEKRFVDCAARLVVYHRGADGKAARLAARPTVYGGIYDRVLRRYVRTDDGRLALPARALEIPCHAEQLKLLEHKKPGVMRVIAKGAMGAGKSEAIVARGFINALKRPNTKGGMVAPISNQRTTIWDKLVALVGPMGLIEELSHSRKQVKLVNGVVIDVLSAKKQSRDRGSPMQGKSWDWCVVDESSSIDDDAHEEITARGRANADRYVVYEATTNDDYAHFILRMERYNLRPDRYEILKFYGHSNPWVPLEQWERLRLEMSDSDYRRRVLLEDIPRERRLYPRFDVAVHLRKRPAAEDDITELVTAEKYQRRCKYVVGQDFGALVTASVIMKCFRGPGGYNDRQWWAIDEITTRGEYSDRHARLLKGKYNVDELIVIADPHFNSRESDKSDYALFRKEGIVIVPAASKPGGGAAQIPRKHRIQMVNALLLDGQKQQHLFVDTNGDGRPTCERLVQSFLTLQYDEDGNPEQDKKDKRDMTHWTCALGYGVYPFEKLRTSGIRVLGPSGEL